MLNLSEEGNSIMEVLPVDPRPRSGRDLLLNSVINLLFCTLFQTKALAMVSPLGRREEREGTRRGRSVVEEVSVKGPTIILFHTSAKSHNVHPSFPSSHSSLLPSYPPSLPLVPPFLSSLPPSLPLLPPSLPPFLSSLPPFLPPFLPPSLPTLW